VQMMAVDTDFKELKPHYFIIVYKSSKICLPADSIFTIDWTKLASVRVRDR
jgi:hypothetical protein